jgi:hypothetical protein
MKQNFQNSKIDKKDQHSDRVGFVLFGTNRLPRQFVLIIFVWGACGWGCSSASNNRSPSVF